MWTPFTRTSRPFLISAIIIATIGCGESVDRSGRTDDLTTLHMGNGGEPKSLDPHLVTGTIEERVLSSLFEGLVNMDFDTMQPVPGVAESWEISDDATVYTFHFREDARWSNGDLVTAHDFVYSWRRILSPGLAAEYAYMLFPILNAEAFNRGDLTDFDEVGVKALDTRTLRVQLRAPTPYFLTLQVHFTFYPVHKPTIEAHGDMLQRDTRWTRPGNLVSNGPFKLTSWSPNEEITVSRNSEYWGRESVALERVVYHPIQNPSVSERSFRAGELQLTTTVPITKLPTYRDKHPELIRIDTYIATEFLRFNTTRKPFTDPRVRRALAHAIDRDAIVEYVLKGGQQPAAAFVPPGTGGYIYEAPDSNEVPFPGYDPTQARELLTEAGYPNGEGFPPVTLIYDTNENVRIYCEALQSMWKTELGIHIELQNMDGKTWLASMIALDYDLARSFWVADYPDASNFLDMFYASSGNNRTGFANPEFEALIRGAASESDPLKRHAAYHSAESILLLEAPIAPIYHQTRAYLVSRQLTGLSSNNLGRIDFRRLALMP